MLIAHLGVAVCAVGACMATIYADQRDLRLEPGKSVEVGGHRFELLRVDRVEGPNYLADEGVIHVFKDEIFVAELKPQKRRYKSSGKIMTEAGIDAGFMRDVYVALGEPLNNGAWSIGVYFKPFVRWIWLGTILMSLGGLVALGDKRYRKKKASVDLGVSAKEGEAHATV